MFHYSNFISTKPNKWAIFYLMCLGSAESGSCSPYDLLNGCFLNSQSQALKPVTKSPIHNWLSAEIGREKFSFWTVASLGMNHFICNFSPINIHTRSCIAKPINIDTQHLAVMIQGTNKPLLYKHRSKSVLFSPARRSQGVWRPPVHRWMEGKDRVEGTNEPCSALGSGGSSSPSSTVTRGTGHSHPQYTGLLHQFPQSKQCLAPKERGKKRRK